MMMRGNYAAIAACIDKSGVEILRELQTQLESVINNAPEPSKKSNRKRFAELVSKK